MKIIGKTRTTGTALMLAFALSLSACGNGQEDVGSSVNGIPIESSQSPQPQQGGLAENAGDAGNANVGNESGGTHMANPQDSDADENGTNASGNVQPPAGTGAVHAYDFSGKVSGCYYAGDNMVIVAADKLYLYDTQKGESIAAADISMGDLCVQTCSEGYFVVGQENGGGSGGSLAASQSDGINGYLLNRDFEIQETVSFSGLLSDDFVLGITAVAISQDGKKMAFGGLRGLYLYDVAAGNVSVILDYFQNGTANNMQILNIDSLVFTGAGTLAYTGIAAGSSDSGDGVSVYGTVSIDSAKLTITRKADYEVGELQKAGHFLAMPQNFDKSNGTLLMLDTASNTEKIIAFSSGSEGKDGVFCSQQGKYVATAVLEDNSVTIRIYDTASGKAIHTETIEDSDSTYFLRIPQILVLDESNTCIVLLGRGISQVDTLITTFGFEG